MSTILIVEDNATARELLVELLRDARYPVIEAEDGAEALRLAHTQHPDLIISDVLMPEMNGYELVRHLRTDPETALIEVIFHSAVFNEPEAHDLARDCGVTHVISKPTEPKKILNTVAEVLRAKGTEPTSPLPASFDHKHQQLLTGKLMQQIDALDRSEERFRMLAEHATDIVFRYHLHPTRAWEYVNPAATIILGYEPREYYADPKLLYKIVHPDSRGELESWIDARCASGDTTEIRWIHKDGRTVWTEIRSTPLRDVVGNLVAVEGIARDITERKTAEAKLEALNKELLRSNKELEDFAYIASHDLREPLRGINSFSSFLVQDYGDKLGEDGCSKLRTVMRLTKRMEDFIDVLLTYSRVGRLELAFEETDLGAVLNEVIDSHGLLLQETGAVVRIERPLPVVRCDPVRIREVFGNLIANAIKYNNGPEKRVEIGYELQEERSAPSAQDKLQPPGGDEGRSDSIPYVFYIRDNGIGIRAKHFEAIFKIFRRLHGREEFGGGTGAGLTITKKIIERHGGRIWLESTYGKGATFYFTLQGDEHAGKDEPADSHRRGQSRGL